MASSNLQNLDLADMAQRLTETECRLAYQEDSLQALSDQLAHQQQRITQLEASLTLLYRQQQDWLASGNTETDGMPAHEKPPHY